MSLLDEPGVKGKQPPEAVKVIETREELRRILRSVGVYGVNDMMSPPRNTMYVDRLREADFDSMVLTIEKFLDSRA